MHYTSGFLKHFFGSPHRSAFFVFCSDYRPKVKSEYPGISIGDIAKKLGEQWSKLSAKDKVPYEQKAGKLKEKYEKVCLFFCFNDGFEQIFSTSCFVT